MATFSRYGGCGMGRTDHGREGHGEGRHRGIFTAGVVSLAHRRARRQHQPRRADGRVARLVLCDGAQCDRRPQGRINRPHPRDRDDHRRQERCRHQADDVEAEGRGRGTAGDRERRSSTRSRAKRRASARSRTRCAGRCRSSWRPRSNNRFRGSRSGAVRVQGSRFGSNVPGPIVAPAMGDPLN